MKKRIIDFRAWDKFTKKMWSWEEHNAFSTCTGSIRQWFNDSDLIQMQWTGFYDKKGKKIYEGDIVLNYGDTYKIVYVAPSFREVGINNPRNRVMPDGFGSNSIFQLEVIGNVFQHPKLLLKK